MEMLNKEIRYKVREGNFIIVVMYQSTCTCTITSTAIPKDNTSEIKYVMTMLFDQTKSCHKLFFALDLFLIFEYII